MFLTLNSNWLNLKAQLIELGIYACNIELKNKTEPMYWRMGKQIMLYLYTKWMVSEDVHELIQSEVSRT